MAKQPKKCVITDAVTAALDQVKHPGCGAMFVVSAVSQALGCSIDEVAKNEVHMSVLSNKHFLVTDLFFSIGMESFSLILLEELKKKTILQYW